MKKWWRKVPKTTDKSGLVPGEPTAEPDRLWPVIDVLEAEKNRDADRTD